MTRRAGSSLVELVMTLMLIGLIGVMCTLLMRTQSRLLRHNTESAAAAEVMRSARAVLHGELRDITRPDVRAVAADSIGLRVFRGWAIVCATHEMRATLRYRGLRSPDASKDSLLVLGEDRVMSFTQSARPALPCELRADEQQESIEATTALRTGSVVLVFESGAYHFAASALRYRRGAEGRQPITDELLDHRASRFTLDPAERGVSVRLRTRGRRLDGAHDLHVRFPSP